VSGSEGFAVFPSDLQVASKVFLQVGHDYKEPFPPACEGLLITAWSRVAWWPLDEENPW
jgi:hypothetical protein